MALFKSTPKKVSEPMGRELLDIVVRALDSQKIKYTVDTGKLTVKVIYTTETFDLNAFIHTYEDRSTLALDGPLDFTIPASARSRVLEKINDVNIKLHYGAFTLEDDKVWYRFHVFPTGVISVDELLGILKMFLKTIDSHDDDIHSVI
ncbi:MAG: YbjN domain-containing protein [archaeon]|nr:YbjN domain-containing protein [archaeon]